MEDLLQKLRLRCLTFYSFAEEFRTGHEQDQHKSSGDQIQLKIDFPSVRCSSMMKR